MCESHHTMPKRLQGFKDDTFQSLPPVSRKKFSMGTNSLIGDASLSPAVLPVPQDVTPQLSPVLRKKLWELDQSYHCIVVGTCLSLAETAVASTALGWFRVSLRHGLRFAPRIRRCGTSRHARKSTDP